MPTLEIGRYRTPIRPVSTNRIAILETFSASAPSIIGVIHHRPAVGVAAVAAAVGAAGERGACGRTMRLSDCPLALIHLP